MDLCEVASLFHFNKLLLTIGENYAKSAYC